MTKTYDPTKLPIELQTAGVQMLGCDSKGNIFWPDGEVNSADLALVDTILKAHDPNPALDPLAEFTKAGITRDQILVALWNSSIKGDKSTATNLDSLVSNLKGV